MTRHPEDEVLFDLVDGALDDVRADLVRRHLARCAACAAFVEAATAGGAAAADLVEPVPEAHATQLDVAVSAAWRARRASILAGERAEDASAPDADDPAVIGSIPAAPRPAPPRRRTRWLVPVLGFAVLAMLAGTSIYLGTDAAPDRDSATNADDGAGITAGEGVPASAPTDAPGPNVDVPEANEISGGTPDPSATGAAGAAADSAERDAKSTQRETEDPAFSVPPVGLEGEEEADTAVGTPTSGGDMVSDLPADDVVCVASLDPATGFLLPDGRSPQVIYEGPLGLTVFCG